MTLLIDDIRRYRLESHPFCGPTMTEAAQDELARADLPVFAVDNAVNRWFADYPTAAGQRELVRDVNVFLPFATFWMEARMSGAMARTPIEAIAPQATDRPDAWGILTVVTDLWEPLKADDPEATATELGARARHAYNQRVLTIDPGEDAEGEDLTAKMLVESPLRYLYECHIVFRHPGTTRPVGPVATVLVPLTPEGTSAVAFDETDPLAIQGYLATPRLTPAQRRRAAEAAVVWVLPFLFACALVRCANVETVAYVADDRLDRAYQKRSGHPRSPWYLCTVDGDRVVPEGLFVVADGTQTWEGVAA